MTKINGAKAIGKFAVTCLAFTTAFCGAIAGLTAGILITQRRMLANQEAQLLQQGVIPDQPGNVWERVSSSHRG